VPSQANDSGSFVMPEMVRAYDAAGEEKRSAIRDMWSFKEWVVLPFETNPFP